MVLFCFVLFFNSKSFRKCTLTVLAPSREGWEGGVRLSETYHVNSPLGVSSRRGASLQSRPAHLGRTAVPALASVTPGPRLGWPPPGRLLLPALPLAHTPTVWILEPRPRPDSGPGCLRSPLLSAVRAPLSRRFLLLSVLSSLLAEPSVSCHVCFAGRASSHQ